jgi:hypothetical protein
MNQTESASAVSAIQCPTEKFARGEARFQRFVIRSIEFLGAPPQPQLT